MMPYSSQGEPLLAIAWCRPGQWRRGRSRVEYERVIGEWLADGCRLPLSDSTGPSSVTVVELVAACRGHAPRPVDDDPGAGRRVFSELSPH